MCLVKIQNFINGKMINSFSNEKVKITSHFFPSFEIEIPNSDPVDLAIALSSAKKAQEKVEQLSLEERAKILENAAKNFRVTDDEIQYAVKMLGMPKKVVLEKVLGIRHILEQQFDFSKKRYKYLRHEFLHHHFDDGAFVYKRPLDKLTAAFLPGNDITVSAFVLANAVLSGSRVIAKPSKEEPYFAMKVARLITEAGYPEGAINIVTWNSSDKNRKNMAHVLISETQVRVVFGDDSTLQTLRFQELEGQLKDHGVNGSFILYGTGRSKAIVDRDTNPNKVAESLAESSLSYYIGCTSTKAAFIHEAVYDSVVQSLVKEFDRKIVGNPLHDNIDIGFAKDLQMVFGRIKETERFGLIKVLNGKPQLKNDFQANKPILLEATDMNSEFLKQEYAVPILTLYKYSGLLADGIKLLNEASFVSDEHSKSLAVAVYTNSVQKYLLDILKINAHHININMSTSFQHLGLPHQGRHLQDEFSEDVSISVF